MEKDPSEVSLVVRSPAFGANGFIPITFSAEGDNVPPPLVWERVPAHARSIAIICEDPDAPSRVFTHWVVTGIAPETTHFDPSAPPPGTLFGKNDHGSLGWYGPNPPSGCHRYFFKVFALDIDLGKEGMSKTELYAAIKGHVVARGEIIGTYEKKTARGSSPNLKSATGSER